MIVDVNTTVGQDEPRTRQSFESSLNKLADFAYPLATDIVDYWISGAEKVELLVAIDDGAPTVVEIEDLHLKTQPDICQELTNKLSALGWP